MSEEEHRSVIETVAAVNEVATKGPVGALLTPIATVFGQALGAYGEQVLKHRQTNLEAHTQAVMGGSIDPDLNASRSLDLFSWAEEAQNVALTDIELSAKVRAALKCSLGGHSQSAELVMRLSRDEIIALTGNGLVSRETSQSLSAKGVLVPTFVFAQFILPSVRRRRLKVEGHNIVGNIVSSLTSVAVLCASLVFMSLYSHKFISAWETFSSYKTEVARGEVQLLELKAIEGLIDSQVSTVTDAAAVEQREELIDSFKTKRTIYADTFSRIDEYRQRHDTEKVWLIYLLGLLLLASLSYSSYISNMLKRGWKISDTGVEVQKMLRQYLR